jgi:predicted nucleic acid-binding protein
MKVIIDTNIIIDILEHREPYFQDSYRTILLGLQDKLEALLSAAAVADIYFIISRSIGDSKKVQEKINALNVLIKICDTTSEDVNTALSLNMAGFEDAMIAAIAKRETADYIVTRNEKAFAGSPVPAISPSQLLGQF